MTNDASRWLGLVLAQRPTYREIPVPGSSLWQPGSLGSVRKSWLDFSGPASRLGRQYHLTILTLLRDSAHARDQSISGSHTARAQRRRGGRDRAGAALRALYPPGGARPDGGSTAEAVDRLHGHLPVGAGELFRTRRPGPV